MTILSAQSIRRLCSEMRTAYDVTPMISPFHERSVSHGMTFGLGPAGYDIRIAESIVLPPHSFSLASSMERFALPAKVIAFAMDKSTWARQGLSLFNTVLEPGWRGVLTIELANQTEREITITAGMPIAQIVFHLLDEPTEQPYTGKYQHQAAGAQPAILEGQYEEAGAADS